MIKKIISIIILIVLIGGVVYCITNKKPTSDEIKFKKEYESINNETSSSGKKIRTVNIPSNNLMEYKTAEELVKKINNKETFIVYFGFNTCPWCRSVIETLIETAKDNNIKTIYYVDVKEIRDVYSLDDDNKLVKEKDGTKGYNELIKLLDNVLSEYTLSTETNEKIPVGEKRIYAPNIISIVKGKAKIMETGISSQETDPYMKLTKEMLSDTKKAFTKVINRLN